MVITKSLLREGNSDYFQLITFSFLSNFFLKKKFLAKIIYVLNFLLIIITRWRLHLHLYKLNEFHEFKTLVSAITQGSYIRYYTAVWYDTAALKEHRSRSRRDTSTSGYPGDATLNLRLHALDRFVKPSNQPTTRFCSPRAGEKKKSRR